MFALIKQPIYKRLYGNLEGKYTAAKWINHSGFYIGCYSYTKNDEVEFILESFDDFVFG